MSIQIAHEAPLSVFEKMQGWTDYDYALVHLFEENERYLNHFKNAVKSGRTVYLDNSIFELGTAFDPDRFRYWINELKPTWYIIPDALEDCNKTLAQAYDWWIHPDRPKRGYTIAVAQGNSYEDLAHCYSVLRRMDGIDMIAISFDYSFFEDWFPDEPTKYHRWMKGRIELLDRLTKDNVIDIYRPHHLLGCGLPQEGRLGNYYKKYPWIHSMDTSNPVIHGLLDISYNDLEGLENKESVKLFTLIDSSADSVKLAAIKYNVKLFRMMWRGTAMESISW